MRAAFGRTPFPYGIALTAARLLPVAVLFVANQFVDAYNFGALTVVVTAITTAMLLSDAGMDSAAGWAASRTSTVCEGERVIGSLALLRVAVAGVATIFLAGPAVAAEFDAPTGVAMILLAVCGNSLAAYNGARRIAFRVAGAGERQALLIEKATVALWFGAALIVVSPSAEPMILAFLGANLIGPLTALVTVSGAQVRLQRTAVRALLDVAAPFLCTTAVSAVVWRSGIFVLAATGRTEVAGAMALALYVVQLFSMVPNLGAPLLLVAGRSGLSARASSQAAVAAGTTVAVAIWFVTLVLPQPSADVLGGSSGVEALRVLALSMPLLWLNPIVVAHLRATSGVWTPLRVLVPVGLLSIPATLLVVPSGGAVGAAGVILAGELATAVLCGFLLRSRLPTITLMTRQIGSGGMLAAGSLTVVALLVGWSIGSAEISARLYQPAVGVLLLGFALVADGQPSRIPRLLRPSTLLALAALIGSLGATALSNEDFRQYEALWFGQVAGFVLGYAFYGRSHLGRGTGSRIIDTARVARLGTAVWYLAVAAGLTFFTLKGVPALGPSVEQGRVDVASTGTGYLRLVAYMAGPAVLLIASHRGWRAAVPKVLVTGLLIVGLGNRSPLVYLLLPLAVLVVTESSRRVGTLRIVGAIAVVSALVVGIGTYRIVSQPDFENYAEYREALSNDDYARVAWVSTEHYAKVVPANAVLVRKLVDEGAIEPQYGATYATLILTALPGKQLTPDYLIKQASGKTFLGGGTPPTLAGEGYMNAGFWGTILSAALVMFTLRYWADRWNANRAAGLDLTARPTAVMYGYLATWSLLAQVAGIAGASTVPLAGFLLLLGVLAMATNRAGARQ